MAAYAMSTCFSFFSSLTNSSGTLSVAATMCDGVSASHCVSEMSSTRSDL